MKQQKKFFITFASAWVVAESILFYYHKHDVLFGEFRDGSVKNTIEYGIYFEFNCLKTLDVAIGKVNAKASFRI